MEDKLERSKEHTRILIKDSGVYKFEKGSKNRLLTSSVSEPGFDPKDFYDRRS